MRGAIGPRRFQCGAVGTPRPTTSEHCFGNRPKLSVRFWTENAIVKRGRFWQRSCPAQQPIQHGRTILLRRFSQPQREGQGCGARLLPLRLERGEGWGEVSKSLFVAEGRAEGVV